MATQKTRSTRGNWQDIRPVQKPVLQIAPKKRAKFSLSLPAFSKPKIALLTSVTKRLKRIKRKKLVIGVTLLFALLLCAIGYTVFKPGAVQSADETRTDTTATASPTLKKGTPEYPTVLPGGKNISMLGGWTRISPPDSDPVFTYTDKIGEQPINVSEQPLPEDFRIETDKKVESMAESFMANEKISVEGTIVHIGSTKNGAQSVIFTKNGLLILIKSAARIDNTLWSNYINSLS